MSKPSITRNRADRPSSDFYPTPEHVTEALLQRERFRGVIWEPACGCGDMSRVIERHGYDVRSTDLFDRGYGAAGIDFVMETELDPKIGAIVTNPPFKLAEAFIETCFRLDVDKFAVFQRLSFIEGRGRYRRIFKNRPPARVWAFSQRVTLQPAGERGERRKSGFMAFAWYVWDRPTWEKPGRTTELHWIGDE